MTNFLTISSFSTKFRQHCAAISNRDEVKNIFFPRASEEHFLKL
jgi:hypothetical protein